MRWKNDRGVWITKGLFYELTLPDSRDYCVYTLKEEDHTDSEGNNYVSLKRLFLQYDDPTEYTFAKQCLGGWNHWKKLQETPDLMPHVADWREERDVMLRSKGVKKLMDMATGDEASFQSAKYLAEKGWELNSKGRPSKEKIKQEAKQQAQMRSILEQDWERISKH